ncbi:MAG: hypothetical protein O2992_02190 [Gemmatimonadetes bacterium]|nr:hypothetical protein [Gemmatimonadota bacterium]
MQIFSDGTLSQLGEVESHGLGDLQRHLGYHLLHDALRDHRSQVHAHTMAIWPGSHLGQAVAMLANWACLVGS